MRILTRNWADLASKLQCIPTFNEIWHLVQIEHANYEYGTWNRWSWPKIIDLDKLCPNTEICSDFYEIWHSQQMKHVNYEYNTHHDLERSRD